MRRLSLIVLLLAAAPAFAQGFMTPAPVAYMKDLSTGTVLFAKDADRHIPPASMGKMMTIYVAFELLKRGQASLDQKLEVRPETWTKWHSQGSTMFLAVGEQPTVEQLLHGIVTLSGNDACVVLAEGLAGTEEGYVALMNRTARRMGLRNSFYANTTGWPDANEHVSARDLAIVAERTIEDHPDLYRRFYGKRDFTWGKTLGAGRPITQGNRNPILGRIPGADGLKTGHTEEAGYGFTGSATQGGRRLVMVLTGLSSMSERVAQSVAFMNWGFRAFESVRLARAGQTMGTAQVHLGDADTVALVAPADVRVTVPRATRDGIRSRVVYNGPVKAPIAQGQKIAELVVTGPGGEQRLPLVAAQAVGEAGPLGRIVANLRGLFGG